MTLPPFTLRATALLTLLSGTFAPNAWSQTPPDAGRTLQQQRTPPEPPRASPPLQVQPPVAVAGAAGDTRVTLRALSFAGNSVFGAEELSAVLGDALGKSYDLAGLQVLAQRLTAHYQGQGYPFARALLPAQILADGVLRVEILEGRYGKVRATGEFELAGPAQTYLSGLQGGQVIHSAALERATLLLDDLPGISATPTLRPGQQVGSGDLDVSVQRTARWSGDTGLDNHGNRYTGAYQARVNLQANSPFLLGDQLSLNAQASDAAQWTGQLGYSLPLSSDGLRGALAVSQTAYQLGQDFASLDASGVARTLAAHLSQRLIRSTGRNLTLDIGLQRKRLNDQQGSTGTRNDKSSRSLPISLQFDQRDGLGGGGVTYGAVTFTAGHLSLNGAQAAADGSGAQSAGRYHKWTLDLARVQVLPAGWTLYGRVASQQATKNLDSSEDFGLGGSNGVRAYPVGEGYGDRGWLAQLELRASVGAFAPYAFHDLGRVTTNAKPWGTGSNERHLGGVGAGLRYAEGPVSVDASLAWPTQGGRAQSDTREVKPRLWAAAAWRF